jgi:hypothetical protein
VTAKLARRVRMLSAGHGRKTDQADALSVGIAAHTVTRLSTAVVDEAMAALRVLTDTATIWSAPGRSPSTGCTRCSPSSFPLGWPAG